MVLDKCEQWRIGLKLASAILLATIFVPASLAAQQADEVGPWNTYATPWVDYGQDPPDFVSAGEVVTSWIHEEEVEHLDNGHVAYWDHTRFWQEQDNRVVYLLTRWELDCNRRARRTSQSGYDKDGVSVVEIDREQDWFYFRPNSQEGQVEALLCKD